MRENRIIPARAGFTDLVFDDEIFGRDHPRSRGVYSMPMRKFSVRDGSSPLARGLRRHTGPGRRTRRDHPRSRGVYRQRPWEPVCGPGSSPLARGLRMGRSRGIFLSGIIPARAGFTHSQDCRQNRVEDHPRSRGVYTMFPRLKIASGGSSPLARGLPPPIVRACGRGGIIPARAGFTPTNKLVGRPS